MEQFVQFISKDHCILVKTDWSSNKQTRASSETRDVGTNGKQVFDHFCSRPVSTVECVFDMRLSYGPLNIQSTVSSTIIFHVSREWEKKRIKKARNHTRKIKKNKMSTYSKWMHSACTCTYHDHILEKCTHCHSSLHPRNNLKNTRETQMREYLSKNRFLFSNLNIFSLFYAVGEMRKSTRIAENSRQRFLP